MHELIKSVSVDNFLNQLDSIRIMLQQIQTLAYQAEAVASQHRLSIGAFFGSSRDYIRPVLNQESGVDDFMKGLSTKAWDYLMEESGLKAFMSAKTRQEWADTIQKGETPELTRENIAQTFVGLYDSRFDMLEQGVIECFRNLSWDYKTNQPYKFGKRIVLTYLISSHGGLNHRVCDQLDDLVRVFTKLEGKPEPEYRHRVYGRIASARQTANFLEHEYFTLKWFKKGTGHLTFKKSTLVDRLNEILARQYPNALASRT